MYKPLACSKVISSGNAALIKVVGINAELLLPLRQKPYLL